MGLFNLFGNSNSKEKEYLEKIEKLEARLLLKEKEIENLVSELELSTKTSPRQLEVFEKNIRETREEVSKLSKILKHHDIDIKKALYKYKLRVDKFFANKKYEEFVNILNDKNIIYLDDLTNDFLDLNFKDTPYYEEVKNKLNDYATGKIDSEILLSVNRGDRLSKVYSKSRKALNVFNKYYLEFMDDLEHFDFNLLLEQAIAEDKIKELQDMRDEYYKERRSEIK